MTKEGRDCVHMQRAVAILLFTARRPQCFCSTQTAAAAVPVSPCSAACDGGRTPGYSFAKASLHQRCSRTMRTVALQGAMRAAEGLLSRSSGSPNIFPPMGAAACVFGRSMTPRVAIGNTPLSTFTP